MGFDRYCVNHSSPGLRATKKKVRQERRLLPASFTIPIGTNNRLASGQATTPSRIGKGGVVKTGSWPLSRIQSSEFLPLEPFSPEAGPSGTRSSQGSPLGLVPLGKVERHQPIIREFIDYTTSMITNEDPLRGLLFY